MANLYSLVYVSKNGDKKVIPFTKEKGVVREKLALSSIDSYTTNFSSCEELLSELNGLGYNLSDGTFQIEYSNKGKVKKTEVIYSDKKLIKKIALENNGKSVIKKDLSYTRYFIYLMRTIQFEPEIFKYLKSYHYISPMLAQSIGEYLHYVDLEIDIEMNYRKIEINKFLTQYKTIREIEIGISNYRKRGEVSIDDTPLTKQKNIEEEPRQLKLF